MRNVLISLAAAGLFVGSAFAAQDTTLTQRQVRDPRQLEVILEANATDTETRVASLEGGSTVGSVEPGYIIVGNASTQGVDVAVSGDITMATDGTVAIASGVIVNADIATNAAIVSTKLATAAQTSLGLADSAYQPNGTDLLTEGYFDVTGTTQLVFIASGVTNVIDADITSE